MNWKKGRGKLGILQPLIGKWQATNDSSRGPYTCTKTFKSILGGKYLELEVIWQFGPASYEEKAVYGMDDEVLSFWSFTSDGKKSVGRLADGTDVHPDAICFEAQMPAGLARMIYWPGEDGTVHWAVESQSKKGWNRFTEHVYHREN